MNDIVVLIIIAVIGLISAVIRAGRKKAEELSRTDDAGNTNDPWEEIIRGFQPYVTEVAKEPLLQPEQGLEHQQIDEEKEAELLRLKRIQDVRNRRTMESKLVADSSQNEAVQEEEHTSIFDGFNAREAVIYSEILKPKF